MSFDASFGDTEDWLRVGSPWPLLVRLIFMTLVKLEKGILNSTDADSVQFTTIVALHRSRFGRI